MASSKKKAQPKAKKAAKHAKPAARKPSTPKPAAKPAARKPTAADKAGEKKRIAALKELERQTENQRRELKKLKEAQEKEMGRLKSLQKEEADRRDAMKKADADRKAADKQADLDKKLAAKDAERHSREAARKAEQDRKAAEREAEKVRKAEEKVAAKAAAEAAKIAAAQAKRRVPSTSIAATPILRPYSSDAQIQLAPPPPAAKPGHADHQVLSAVSYGLFAAINKTFGFAGQSVVKNAALRMLEYGYKRAWLPPKSKEPIRALNEFFGRLETMGYADKIHVAKRGDNYVLEVVGLADFDAVHELRTMHYPLLPIFLGEMMIAIIDQYFRMRVTTEPIEFQEQKRGFNLPFSIHEPTVAPEISRLQTYSRVDDFEE